MKDKVPSSYAGARAAQLMRVLAKWAKLLSLSLLALVLTGILVGWAYQAIMEARDDRRYPPRGRLVEVSGHRMHIDCKGQGSPTVIIEQGIGVQSLSWSQVNEHLSAITTVCAYDRVGMGHSDPVDHPTSSREVAENLHGLLQAAGVTGDIVLVGWSAGGMYAREYYRQFPDRVKGMVLVDSAHEQQSVRMPPPQDIPFNPIVVYQYLAPIGWIRASGMLERQIAKSPLPIPVKQRLVAVRSKAHMYRTLVAEGEGFLADLAENRAPPDLGEMPLIVLTAGKPGDPFMTENLTVWLELHRELSRLSTNGKHIIATKSAHAIHRSEPDLIIDSVHDVVSAVRGEQH